MRYSDEYFYRKLEINTIFDLAKSNAVLEITKKYFDNIKPLDSLEEIRVELEKVNEAAVITRRISSCSIFLDSDYDALLNQASIGAMLSGVDVYETVRLFSSIRSNKRLQEDIIKYKIPDIKYFNQYVDSFVILEELEKTLRKSVDDNGEVLDTASPELKKIRNKLKGIDDRIKNKLQELISTQSSYLAEKMVVLRDERYCLPIKVEYKNTYRGLLHDVSASNLTAFMEPLIIAEMSNEKEHLKNEEKEEINRILKNLSGLIGENKEVLSNNYHVLYELDKIFSKAILGNTFDCYLPHINSDGITSLVNARHPFIDKNKVIPNNIEFGKDYSGIVITGPNTGGKTVLLKTVGLLSLMVKFGFLIPADSVSNVMIYDHILCDIGDDQSIQENLSTFSSHMKKMVAIVNKVTPSSLALFDEIGAGTDPVEGSSIAVSVLNYFLKSNVSFVVTTHYAELKAFAYSADRVVNASMAFNEDTFKPTYHLIIGRSGSSNAFSIAQSLGLKKSIINDAKKNVNESKDRTRSFIVNIEKRSNELKKLEEEYRANLIKVQEEKAELEKKLENIEKEKERTLAAAKLEANKIIDKATLEANQLIEQIKELQAKNLKLHEIIDAQNLVTNLDESRPVQKKKAKKQKINKKPEVSDQVFLEEYQQFGVITRINRDGSYDISIGNITISAEKDEFEVTGKIEEKESQIVIDRGASTSKVGLSLDLRGERYEIAKDKLDKYIDELLMNGIKSATIIHGFGTGALREMVQTYLKKCKFVDSYRYGGEGEGGLGVTVIQLK